MAAPTVPTLVSITTEGIKKAGHSTPSSAQLTRAQDEWMQEIKNDIWTKEKKLKSLQTSNIFVLTEGEGLISCPSDFSAHLGMQLLEPTHYGVCQAGGSTTTAKLASDEDMTSTYPVGKEIVVYLTATKTTTYSSFITAFNTTTKVATFSPAITVSPDATYSYMVVDTYKPIEQRSIMRYDEIYRYSERGTPFAFYPIGDADSGEYYLYHVPYWNDSVPRAIRQRYYAKLMSLDLAGTLVSTLYQNLEMTFKQGIYAKQLDDDDDRRYRAEMDKYRRMILETISSETYGSDLSNMQATVE
jgi:hypothetical protein